MPLFEGAASVFTASAFAPSVFAPSVFTASALGAVSAVLVSVTGSFFAAVFLVFLSSTDIIFPHAGFAASFATLPYTTHEKARRAPTFAFTGGGASTGADNRARRNSRKVDV